MRWVAMAVAFLACTTAAFGDVHPERLAAYEASCRATLSGFTLGHNGSLSGGRAEASITRSYYHGYTEVRVSIHRYSTADDAMHAGASFVVGSSAVMACWRALQDGRYEELPHAALAHALWPEHEIPAARFKPRFTAARWRGQDHSDDHPNVILAGRMLIVLLALQHDRMDRRSPDLTKPTLSDAQMHHLAARLTRDLTRIAMAELSATRSPSVSRGRGAPGADVHPEQLAAYEFGKLPWMSGFDEARPTPFGFSAAERDSGAGAAIHRQFFHGATELRYSVLRFNDAAQALRWVAGYASMCQGPVSCWRALPTGRFESVPRKQLYPKWPTVANAPERPTLIAARWKGRTGPVTPLPPLVLADCTVLVVGAYQHLEMKRRNPAAYGKALPDAEMNRCAGRLVVEFARAAMVDEDRRRPRGRGADLPRGSNQKGPP